MVVILTRASGLSIFEKCDKFLSKCSSSSLFSFDIPFKFYKTFIGLCKIFLERDIHDYVLQRGLIVASLIKTGVNKISYFAEPAIRVILKNTFPLQFNVTISHQNLNAEMPLLSRPCNFEGLLFEARRNIHLEILKFFH